MHPLARLTLFPLLLASACAQDEDPDLPSGPAITYEPAFPAQAGFDRPLFVAFDAHFPGEAFVVTQPGKVFVVPRDGSKSDRRVFLDLAGRVFTDNWEEGLLGFAFDPAFAQNGFVYACWSEKVPNREQVMSDGRKAGSNRQSVISRFGTVLSPGGCVVDPDSELRVLEVFQPFGNHNGGTIVFGPDGMLYVALGDGGAANDPFGAGQAKTTLLGKVLRLDVRAASKDQPYSIPADNPFVNEAGARGEIWCYGMRNPWRISFDRETGELWCGDVGQNEIEEVDRLVKGGNYGWNVMEGAQPFRLRQPKGEVPADLIAPIASYEHAAGLSVTGGYVYRGKAIPELVGCFVYGDFMTSRMWAVKEDRAGGKHRVVTLSRAPQQVSSFAETPEGELLITGFEGKKGKVWRLVPAKAAAEAPK
ncbi:MAG: PQQ-dependent sugar dehydrogenase [Planctomycetes bacterium]|nr:PQQ-dependent sugar dehydrogenase [Planctomycetota bacterium]